MSRTLGWHGEAFEMLLSSPFFLYDSLDLFYSKVNSQLKQSSFSFLRSDMQSLCARD